MNDDMENRTVDAWCHRCGVKTYVAYLSKGLCEWCIPEVAEEQRQEQGFHNLMQAHRSTFRHDSHYTDYGSLT